MAFAVQETGAVPSVMLLPASVPGPGVPSTVPPPIIMFDPSVVAPPSVGMPTTPFESPTHAATTPTQTRTESAPRVPRTLRLMVEMMTHRDAFSDGTTRRVVHRTERLSNGPGGGTRALAAALVLVAACGKGDVTAPNDTAKDAATTTAPANDDASGVTADADGAAPRRSSSWIEAVRLERWDEAEMQIAALSDADRAKPEVRFAHARVHLKRGNYKDAIAALDKLEEALPLLTDIIQRARAEAELEVGPFEAAADYFSKRGVPSAWLSAAQAYERAQKPDRAMDACDHVLAFPKRARRDEVRARSIRLRLASPKDPTILEDARWLAIHAEEPDAQASAAHTLEQLDPTHPLMGPELLERAQMLAEGNHTDLAIAMIDRAAVAQKPLTSIEACRAKGEIFFNTKARYADAAATYGTCSNKGGPHAAEDAFLSARALARAEKDNEAIFAWTKVRERWPGTTWAEQATFLAARTHALHAHWKDAADAFDDYKKSFKGGQNEKDADRFRALAHFANKDYKVARRLFEELAGDPSDGSQQARWVVLAAVAAREDGDKNHAIARWNDVARTKPLSWAALVARARLAESGAPLPPAIDPPESGPAPPPLAVALPPPVDVLHAVGLDRDAEDMLRERENIVKGRDAARGVEALCKAYELLGRAKRLHTLAMEIPAAMLAVGPGPKNRWAWDCAYPEPYLDHVREDETKDALPENLVYAVMRQESGYDPEVVSPARAVGLMQLLPETARSVADATHMEHREQDLTVVPHNIALGSHYLHDLFGTFEKDKRDKNAALPLVIASYNAGPEAIDRWLGRAQGLTMDLFVERIPYAETRGYVARVMGNLARYQYRAHGEAGVPKAELALFPQ
jgi:soluble lytic murein transglycosylase